MSDKLVGKLRRAIGKKEDPTLALLKHRQAVIQQQSIFSDAYLDALGKLKP